MTRSGLSSNELSAYPPRKHVARPRARNTRPVFIAGATRRPTNEEIVAGAKAFYEALKPDSYPQWDSDCALRAEYYDAMRLAVKAMQGKAAEE